MTRPAELSARLALLEAQVDEILAILERAEPPPAAKKANTAR